MGDAEQRAGGHPWGRHALPAAVIVALGLGIWVRPQPPAFAGVDAACYARVARELSERPIAEWLEVRLEGAPFHEHPPLAFWLEALAFRVGGASAASATALARLYASLLALLVFLIGRRLAGDRVGLLSAAALLALSGFLFESQNAMLELPLSVALSAGLLALLATARRPGWGYVGLALATAAAVLIKGPPALLLAPLALAAGWLGILSRRAGVVASCVVLMAVVMALGGLEGARHAAHLPSFLGDYLPRRVLQFGLLGRDEPATSPLFYLRHLWRWYAPALLLLPLSVILRRREERDLLTLAWLWAAALVLAFSLAGKRSYWFIHPITPAAAGWMGVVLHRALPARWERAVAAALGVGCLAYLVGVLLSVDLQRATDSEQAAIARSTPPSFDAATPRQVAHCGRLGTWRATHLFGFYWRARLLPCTSEAPYRFDGAELRRVGRSEPPAR